MKKTAVIMAGGHGERFWPKSRLNMPKQFLSLTDDGRSLLQLAVDRMLTLVDIGDVYIVTNMRYRALVAEQLPKLPRENILAEPSARNTAPCIAFAAAVIGAKYDDAVMYVVPSDHIIKNIPLFTDTMLEAGEIARRGGNIVTIGITPSYPETGYGYIHFLRDKSMQQKNAYKVLQFVEKPNIMKAKEYIRDGCYLWNSGMFVWSVSTITEDICSFLPELYGSLVKIKGAAGTDAFTQTVNEEYEKAEPVSIDYGVMEKAENIYTIPGSFGWDDVGGWLALERINQVDGSGNYIKGNVVDLDTENSIVISDGSLTATVGISNIVVVVDGKNVLVCNKDNTQDIKKVVSILKERHMTKYL